MAKRLIKRYSNRKLYDTRGSRYITLQQIGELVRAGEEVQIVDNASKEDVTRVTLAQIVYETEKSALESGESSNDEAGEKARSLASLKTMIQTRGEQWIGNLQRSAEDRARGIAAAAIPPVEKLQGEVKRLAARIDELEETLRKLSKRDE